MSNFQQCPIFSDVALPFAYVAKQDNDTPYVVIDEPGGTGSGTVTLKPGQFFVCTAVRVCTNYDNVALVTSTAESDAILCRPFTANNFTVQCERSNDLRYSNLPIPQAMIGSSGYRTGKMFPFPVVYGERANFIWNFQDLTNLFLLDEGDDPIPLKIELFMEGVGVPQKNWKRFLTCNPSAAFTYAS